MRAVKMFALAGLGACLLIPSIASAKGACKVMVTDGEDPKMGVILDGLAESGPLKPVKTGEDGTALFEWEFEDDSIRVFTRGMEMGVCKDRLIIDLSRFAEDGAGSDDPGQHEEHGHVDEPDPGQVDTDTAGASKTEDGNVIKPDDGLNAGNVKASGKKVDVKAEDSKKNAKKAAKKSKKPSHEVKAQDAP